jgi:hypothetical protein
MSDVGNISSVNLRHEAERMRNATQGSVPASDRTNTDDGGNGSGGMYMGNGGQKKPEAAADPKKEAPRTPPDEHHGQHFDVTI